MLKIQVLKAGVFSTVQDAGRKGMMFYGISRSGFLDFHSAQVANILVGNKKNASCIEMINLGIQLHFSDKATIAITGADMSPQIDGSDISNYETIEISAGSTLSFKGASSGSVVYLAIKGKWQIDKVLSSVSTYTSARIGGLTGSTLKKDDVIIIKESHPEIFMKWHDIPDFDNIKEIKFRKGPEWNYFLNQKQLHQPFSKDASGNRMAAPLNSDIVEIKDDPHFKSKPIIPGMIQCTPSGRLIVILQDGQTTGGYPRIGFISKNQLALFNQLRPSQKFNLKLID
jgi:antagonist of KipI